MPLKITPKQAKAILAKWDAEDPVKHYKAPITLQRAGECKSRYICVRAPNQIGKTAWMQYITASILRGMNTNWNHFGPVNILLVVPKRAQAAEVWGKRLLQKCELYGDIGKHPWIPKREIKKIHWAQSPAGPYPGKIVTKNNSQLVTILSGDPNSWKALEGMTFDIVIRDEVAGNENLGDEIQPRLLASRTRAIDGLQSWGGVVLWSATETKHNEEWLAFVKRCEDGVEDHVLFIPKAEEASAYVSMAAREEMRRSMSAKAFKIRGDGSSTASDALSIFGEQWSDERHMLKNDYIVKDDDNIWVGWDPGMDHPTGIVVAAVTKEDPTQIRVVRCWEYSNQPVEYDVEMLHNFLLGRKIAGVVYDWQAKVRHKHAPALLHVLINAMQARGYDPLAGYVQADKRVEVGIATLKTMLDPEIYDKTASPRIVINPSEESGGQLLRSEFIGYHKSEATPTTKGKIVKKNDDALDAMRYLSRAFPTWDETYRCGQMKYAPNPNLMREPEKRIVKIGEMSEDERRAKLALRFKGRNANSVRREFAQMAWWRRIAR